MHKSFAAALLKASADAEGQKTYTFLASNDTLDRQGEVVTTDGWELANYQRNPVVLDGHDYRSIENVIGRAVALRSTDDGLEADIVFNQSPKGQLATALVEGGDVRAVSVGFMSIEMAVPQDRKEPVRHTKKELMEISLVPVPANPDALRLRSADGEPSTKAGRVLSAANERRLRDAAGLIAAVLSSLPEPAGEAADAAPEAGETDKAADGLDLAALDRLVAGLAAVKQRMGE